jgi:hypothetical protein
MAMNRLERLSAMASKAKEITAEYRKYCVELALNPNYIHDDISTAPNYPAYYGKALEYTELAKARSVTSG